MASTTKKPAMVVGPNSTLVSQALVTRIRNNEFLELAELSEDSQSSIRASGADRHLDITFIQIAEIYMYIYVCGQKNNLNRTLAINLPFQKFAVGLLVKFIDWF